MGPQCAPGQGRRVDAILGEGGQDVVFLPVPLFAECAAKSDGGLFYVEKSVALGCVRIDVDFYPSAMSVTC